MMPQQFQCIPPEVSAVLNKVLERQEKGHPDFYKPLEKHESQIIRKWYTAGIRDLKLEGVEERLLTQSGLILATGYTRIVVGDYGAYVEISPDEILHNNIESKWPGTPSRPVKYIWMVTKEEKPIKVYHQFGRVKYADYKPGMYYVSVEDVKRE